MRHWSERELTVLVDAVLPGERTRREVQKPGATLEVFSFEEHASFARLGCTAQPAIRQEGRQANARRHFVDYTRIS